MDTREKINGIWAFLFVCFWSGVLEVTLYDDIG